MKIDRPKFIKMMIASVMAPIIAAPTLEQRSSIVGKSVEYGDYITVGEKPNNGCIEQVVRVFQEQIKALPLNHAFKKHNLSYIYKKNKTLSRLMEEPVWSIGWKYTDKAA